MQLYFITELFGCKLIINFSPICIQHRTNISFMSVTVIVGVMKTMSETSSSVTLTNGREQDPGTTIGVKTGIGLVLNLLIFNMVEDNPSGLPMFVFTSFILVLTYQFLVYFLKPFLCYNEIPTSLYHYVFQ